MVDLVERIMILLMNRGMIEDKVIMIIEEVMMEIVVGED